MRVIVCAALALVGGTTLHSQSTTGELRFEPSAPRARQTVAVTYRPATSLASQRRVVLRARYRRIADPGSNVPPQNGGVLTTTVGALARHRDGTFGGSFTLPDSVVYAVFDV